MEQIKETFMTSQEKLAKVCAYVIFADGEIKQSEVESAKHLFEKHGFNSDEGEKLVKHYLEEFVHESDEESEDEEISLSDIDFDEVDCYELLKDLANLTVADGEISFDEVEIIHTLAEKYELSPVLASMALLNAVKTTSNIKINVE